ncbi:MAG: hypothetical protein VB064_15205 [Oscillospiraceae bacterium]|nr:hypothetical protein [Oscillospiraceae bacterium]
MELTAFETLLSNAGNIVTGAVTWMGTFLHTITAPGNEILLLFTLLPIVGLGIGLVRRMLHI